MRYGELTRKLRKLDCEFTRQGAGSHEIWRNRSTGRHAPIPYHRTKEIGPVLLGRILGELGISREEFDQA